MKAQRRLEKMGVEIQLGAMVTDVDRNGITVIAAFVVGAALVDAALAIVQRYCSARIGEGLIAIALDHARAGAEHALRVAAGEVPVAVAAIARALRRGAVGGVGGGHVGDRRAAIAKCKDVVVGVVVGQHCPCQARAGGTCARCVQRTRIETRHAAGASDDDAQRIVIWIEFHDSGPRLGGLAQRKQRQRRDSQLIIMKTLHISAYNLPLQIKYCSRQSEIKQRLLPID